MQLRAFARARQQSNSYEGCAVLKARLKLIGGCRNQGDHSRVAALEQEAVALGIAEFVDFHVNAPWEEVKLLLGEAVAGMHTMVDEHFGISIVQFMAAGVVPIANNSGGPKMDILVGIPLLTYRPALGTTQAVRCPGYLCTTEDEYAAAITEVLNMEESRRSSLADIARISSERFSDESFKSDFVEALSGALGGMQ